MGLLDGIRDFYYSLEDGYYSVLDKINENIPVYSIIDPIDKVMPSFALLLAAIVFLIIAAVFTAGGGLAIFPQDTLTVSVLDTKGNGVQGATVTFTRADEELSSKTTSAAGIASQGSLKANDEVEVRIAKEGYLTKTETVNIDELPKTARLEFLKESEAFTEKTLRIVDDLGQPVREALTLEFRCSDPYAPSIPKIELAASNRGVAKVNVPSNCGRLTVSVSDNVKYNDITSVSITGEDETIRLQEAETQAENGTVTASVSDESGNPLDGIQVNLYRYNELAGDPNVGPITSSYTASGKTQFSVPAGSYVLKTYDRSGIYGDETSEKITLANKGTGQAAFMLSETIKGKIKIQVVNKAGGAAIKDARVKLTYSANQELATQTTNASGEAQFNISRDVEYKAFATASGYALGTLTGLKISDTAYKLELAKCTSTTCGSLRVKIVDQDNNPIQHATVALYNAQTNSLAGFDTKSSDINGMAKFNGVGSGNYYAFAFKEGFSGRSDASAFDTTVQETGEANLTIKMEVGEGIITVNVRDIEGRPIPFAQISVFDTRNNSLVKSDFTDSNGTKEFSLRADKKIYVVVSKRDEQVYANYTTTKKPIVPNGVQAFEVVLEKPILKKNLELVLLGFYDAGQRATNVKAGGTYTARLKLYTPEEKNYRTAGVHLRTGEDALLEKDKLFIKEVNAPRIGQTRVAYFEPEQSNLDEADYRVTLGDAKWVNAYWNSPQAGVYEIEAEVEVRDSAKIGDKMSFYYRAWGEKDSLRDRYPIDDTVTKELYANAKQEILQVDTVTLCDSDFCFAATITSFDKDNKADLTESVTETYNAKAFNQYKLNFIITNNSEAKIHNAADLRISNPDKTIKFFDYKIVNAETRETGGILNGFEFPRLDVGNLSPKNSIRFTASFTPQKGGSGAVIIKMASDQQIVYQKMLTVAVASPNEIDATVEPEAFLSGIENDITVTAKDAATGLEVEGAIVRVKDKHGNQLDMDTTLADGTAKVTLPSQKPGDKLRLEIEKPDYNVKVVELEVSDQLLEIKPSQIGLALNTKNKLEAAEKFSVRSLVPYALTIRSIELSGNFRNTIDLVKTRGWLDNSYKGMVLGAETRQELVLKAFLTEDAKGLAERKSFDAELTIVASNFGQEWVFKVPVKIAVGLGDEVDNPACLVVTKSEWVTSTTGKPKRLEMQVQNNCTVGGKPVDLQSLEAKADWKGNQIGDYSLIFNLTNDNKEGQKAVLRSGYFRKLVGSIKAEQAIDMILEFTPYGGVGGVANAEIIIQATNPLDSQDQILSQKVKTTITVANLDTCLTYDKERLTLKQGETGTISVTATDMCGEKVKFSLESKVKTSPKKDFELEPGKTQAIEIFAEQNDPGQYPLYLTAKFGSDQKQQLTKNLRVIINAPGCWQLNKYEFDVYDSPKTELDGFDTASFRNDCVEKPVAVRVNMKDFMDALQDGLAYGLLSMGLTMLTNAADPETDMWGRATDPVTGARIQQKGGGTDAQKYTAEAQKLRKQADEYDQKVLALQRKAETNPADVQAQRDLATARAANAALRQEAAAAQSRTEALQKQLDQEQLKSNPEFNPTRAGDIGSPEAPGEGTGENYPLPEPAPTTPDATAPVPGNEGLTTLPTAQGLVVGLTGYAPASNNNAMGVASSVAGQLGGGIMGNALGGGAGLVRAIFGKSPWAAGLMGLAVGTIVSYMGQEKEANFTIMQKDAEVRTIDLVKGAPPNEVLDDEVALSVEGFGAGGGPTVPQPLVANPNAISQGSETFRMTFTNATKPPFITTEDRPKYKVLAATGVRHKYADKTYDKDDFYDAKGGGFIGFFDTPVLDKSRKTLEEDTPQRLEERWSLEFNAVPPQIEQAVRPEALLNCQAGDKVGETGPDALPNVKFVWNWGAISEKECNEDNIDGIYCDATQFSIALLKKIQAISSYVSQSGPGFKCPSPLEDEPAKNEIGPTDVGIESVGVSKDGKKVKVTARVTNTNSGQASAKVRIKAVKEGATGEVSCPQGAVQELQLNGNSFKEAECTFEGLETRFYKAQVDIEPSVSCEKCGDKAATNSLYRRFFAGETGLQACEPYSTERLDKFLQASGISADNIVKMTKFKARLMADGYSTDFQRDFDLGQRQIFFSAPDYYNNPQNGLGLYFKEPRLFSFDAYSQPDFALPGPGTYDVAVDINYNDGSWQLFDARGNPNAKITIKMTKLKGAEPDSPFYYLPINGRVGDAGRTGYGVNFSGDSIIIDNSPNAVRTVEIAGSSPMTDGVLNVKTSSSFKSMQVDNAGVVAKLNRAQGNPELTFQPSNATPVILQMEKKSGKDAYAVYQVGVDGDAVDVGPTMARWNGVGVLCRAFNDEILAQQQGVPDTHMISSQCSVAKAGDRSLYALEFCGEPKRFGTVSYETIIYTPQGSNSIMRLTGAASDSAKLVGRKTKGQDIVLNGNGATPEIHSLQDVFSLVKDEYLCISSTNINAEFFWNPKKVFGTLGTKHEDAIDACIPSESSQLKAPAK